MEKNKNVISSTLRKNREKLISDIQVISAEIRKQKNELIKIRTILKESIIIFGNYCIDNLCLDTFDTHYAFNKIESIKKLKRDNIFLEGLILKKTNERDKLIEHLNGINDFLCLH